jgi:hypothetical protein
VRPTSDHPHFVASLLLLEKPDGQTLGSLVDALSDQIADTELKSAFLKQCLKKAGQGLYSSNIKIGVLPHGASLAVFGSETIPAPIPGQGQPISNVRFDVDLSDVEALKSAQKQSLLRFES